MPSLSLRFSCFLMALAVAHAATFDCLSTTSMTDFISCKRSHFPPTGSNKYVVPTSQQLTDWKSVVTQIMQGHCADIVMPATLSPNFITSVFTEGPFSYCILHEVLDNDNDGILDRGWTIMAYKPAADGELVIGAPHSLYDIDTELEAAGTFSGLSIARVLLVSGAHRNANSASATCYSSDAEKISDASYNNVHPFFATAVAINQFYGANKWAMYQMHGMGATSCTENVMGSHGVDVLPLISSPLRQLKTYFLNKYPLKTQGWVMGIPKEATSCTLLATTNVVGRYLNGVPEASVCTTSATTPSGKLVHLEQKTANRVASEWIGAIDAIYATTVPTDPFNLTATPASGQVGLKWAGSIPVDSYSVYMSPATTPRAYTTVATGVTTYATTGYGTYAKKSLTRGTVYCFMVQAVNTWGTSVNMSNEACAAAK